MVHIFLYTGTFFVFQNVTYMYLALFWFIKKGEKEKKNPFWTDTQMDDAVRNN